MVKSDTMMNEITISACLIVKNEEDMLPDCLESIKNIVDEIIVVDTGSKDRTVEIAESYGAKVYHHPWENNFSKHRNQSISYAKGEWFLTIDADERLESDNLSVQALKSKLEDLSQDVHAVLVTMKDYTREGELKLVWKVSKLFRNHVGVHFEGEVHNQAVTKGKAADSPLVIRHYGYDLSREKMEKKFERTHSLLQDRIQEHPNDYEAHFYLANIYGGYKKFEKCIETGQKMLEIMPPDVKSEIFLKIYYNIAAAHANLNQFEEAKKWCFKGLKILPDDIDLHYLLVNISVLTKEVDLLRKHSELFLKYLNELEDNRRRVGLRFIYHMADKHKNNAIAHLFAAFAAEDKVRAHKKLYSQYQSAFDNNNSIALKFLEDLAVMELDQQLLHNTVKYLNRTLKHEELIDPLMKKAAENPSLINEFLQQVQSNNALNNNISLVNFLFDKLLEFGMIEKAEDFLENSLSQKDHQEFRIAKESVLAVRKGEPQQALKSIKQGIEQGVDDRQFYLDALLLLYKYNETKLLRLAIERVLQYYESYENIPDYVLLLLSHQLFQDQKIDHLLDVTTMLCRKLDIQPSLNIDSWDEFAEIYNQCAENLLERGKNHMAEMAWKTGFYMTQNGKYLAKIGESYHDKGQYEKALSNYADALKYKFQTPEMVGRMKEIFTAVNDQAGIDECERLLTVYDNAL